MSEQRFMDLKDGDWADYLFKSFTVPLIVYLIWLLCYGLLHFVIAEERIRRRNYSNSYQWISQLPSVKSFLGNYGATMSPIIFLSMHLGLFLANHLFAMA